MAYSYNYLAKANWLLFIALNGLKANPIHELPPGLAGRWG